MNLTARINTGLTSSTNHRDSGSQFIVGSNQPQAKARFFVKKNKP